MTESLINWVRFYVKKRGVAVLVAWLLYVGLNFFIQALNEVLSSVVAASLNAVLLLFFGTEPVTRVSGVWRFVASTVPWGAITMGLGIVLGLTVVRREPNGTQ